MSTNKDLLKFIEFVEKRDTGEFSSYWRMFFRKVIIAIMNILLSIVSSFK